MTRRLTIFVALALAFAVCAEAARTKPPKSTTTSKPTITKTHTAKGGAAKGATVKAAAAKGSSVKATGAQGKAASGKSTKPAKTDVKLAKADAKVTKADAKAAKAEQKANNKGTASNTASPTSASAQAIDFTATALGQKLQKNSALRSKIEAKLQASGYAGTVYEAAYGFKNLGQLNAATNQVQNQGTSFELLKVLMTGTHVDPTTDLVYRANLLPDGTVQLVSPELATNPPSTQSLGQAKQAIAAGAEMPEITLVQPTGTTSGTSATGTLSTSSTAASKGKRKKSTV
jgi:hypothetical protein